MDYDGCWNFTINFVSVGIDPYPIHPRYPRSGVLGPQAAAKKGLVLGAFFRRLCRMVFCENSKMCLLFTHKIWSTSRALQYLWIMFRWKEAIGMVGMVYCRQPGPLMILSSLTIDLPVLSPWESETQNFVSIPSRSAQFWGLFIKGTGVGSWETIVSHSHPRW